MNTAENFLNLDRIYIPLSRHAYFNTNSPDDVNAALYNNFHNGHIDVFNKNKFKMVYNFINIGNISLNAAASSSGFHIHADSDINSFVLIIVSHGELQVRAKNTSLYSVPNERACLLDFEQPCVIAVNTFYNNMTVRFNRLATEHMLEKLTGKPLRTRLRFTNQIDLSQPGPKRLLTLINQITTFFEQDEELIQEHLLVAQYEQLLFTAFLTCLEHNAHSSLYAAQPSAPPKVVGLVENFIEANADKPLNLGDLADLTGMSARSIQLAFKKHRGYSPSQFLRQCRLTRARDMLRNATPGTTVLSVSLACGFGSQSFFCRLYRERFGEKPSETAAKS
ncbi:AraC family transcriptional regulator [Desulfovibrio inopinatus]|uniref:AraC family transcriptional regulator n=1 Tax=Desulfovibrio inopinatus TaxID=102109 RepID=UPI00041589E1|nr:AraC family transcriptional regulator [Desulfovibrio inopinatus]